jgi:hypothetical protein
MVKRASNQMAAKSAAKKAKADPALTSIAQVIMEADHLPDRCRNMLIDTLPFSLTVASDQRHEIQTAVVEMVEQTLTAKKLAMEAAVTAEDVKLVSLKGSQGEVASKADEAEAAVAAQKEIVQTAKSLLAEATEAANASWSTLSDQRAEQKVLDASLDQAKTEKSGLESAFEEHFKPMKEDAAGLHFKGLEPHLKSIEVESSLLIALPSSCAKAKDQRGSFDNVVLEELEKAIINKVTALGETVAAAMPAASDREATIQASEKDYDAKKSKQKELATEFEAAQKDLTDRNVALSSAKKAVLELQPQIDASTELMDKAKLALAEFEAGTMSGFVSYRSATSKSAEAAPAEAAPAEAAPAGA